MSDKNGRVDASTRLAVRYIDADLLLSDTHAWTYLKVPTASYEFLSYEARKSIAQRTLLSLGALVTGTEPVETHLIVTSRPVNEQFWAHKLGQRVAGWRPAPGWERYLQGMREHLDEVGFARKEVYLGVCLGARSEAGSLTSQGLGLLEPVKKLFGRTESLLGFEDDVVAEKELAFFRARAKEVQRSLSQSHIHARPAHPNAVAWLVKKPLHPDMVVPSPTVSPNRVWGPGEVEALAESVIDNTNSRFLVVRQDDPQTGQGREGFVATLCLSRFPDVLLFPDQEPWMHFAAALQFPVTLSTRMTLIPAGTVQKDVGRKLADVKDQASHIVESGKMVPLDVQEQYQRAVGLEYTLSKDRIPWLYGRHRLMVTAGSEDELRARVAKVIEHYRDLSIDVVWPAGDQWNLLREYMPGEKVRAKAYYQRQELMTVAAAMPTASAEVGDQIVDGKGWVGPYLGETTSRVATRVCFAPHVAPTRNKPPGVAITGESGAGKSFLAFTLAYQCAMQGVWTIYIDPKADAIPMAQMPGLGSPQLVDLRDGHDGLLDPFTLADSPAEAPLLALETVRLLLGGELPPGREEALMIAIEEVSQAPEPTLNKVVEHLLASPATDGTNLGRMLKMMRELPFARLCFSDRTGRRLQPEAGMTVITLLGLDLPSEAMAPADYSYENRLAVSVMYLLSRYAKRLMLSMNKSQPKALFIDEAWIIMGTPQGKKLVPEVSRMGRSHNTVLVLVSQNPSDLLGDAIANHISTVFAFRASADTEVNAALSLLNMDAHDGHRAAVRDLRNGECLMKDLDGRFARVQIDSWNEELFNAFNTNPETRGRDRSERQLPSQPGLGDEQNQ